MCGRWVRLSGTTDPVVYVAEQDADRAVPGNTWYRSCRRRTWLKSILGKVNSGGWIKVSGSATGTDEARVLSADTEETLVRAAREAREAAYVPYSGFRVGGAAVLAESGRIYAGCNVENASYGGTICAERTAFVKAISEGERGFLGVAVCGDTPTPISVRDLSPVHGGVWSRYSNNHGRRRRSAFNYDRA